MVYHRYLLAYALLTSLLCAHPVRAALPAILTLGDLNPVYDGQAKTPSVVTDPPNLNVTWSFAERLTETVFRNTPDTLILSYPSLAFANGHSGLGNLVGFAGTARNLESVEAVMVTWAKAEDYPVLATADPAGWRHQVTLSVYSMDANQPVFIGAVTREIFVPWRPLSLPNGDPYIKNGYAFTAHFDFPDGLALPEQAMFMISYNTQNTGYEPIGTPGPYNQLNVALGGNTTIGTDVDPLGTLRVTETDWFYPSNYNAPRFVIKANYIPGPGTSVPPVNAGTWQATALIDDPQYEGETSAAFIIQPAPASIVLHDLVAIYDGNGHDVSATTVPTGLPVHFTYVLSPDLPTDLGRYTVHAEIVDPNYVGSATGELWLGHNFQSWILGLGGSLPQGETGMDDDPDHDSISNFLEYAWGLNPTSPDHGSDSGIPKIGMSAGGLSLIYRKNLSATDLIYAVQTSADLDGPDSWQTTTTIDLVIGDDGQIETLGSPMALDSNESRRFFRVKVGFMASIVLHDLVAIYDGNGHGVSATTVPTGLPVHFTYELSPDMPTDLGRYAVHAEIVDPNYVGSATGELWLGHNFQSWILDGNLPQGETGMDDDPDHDSISNFLEYAWGLNPTSPNHGSDSGIPKIGMSAGGLSLIYRKNLSATDLIYEVQTSTDLDGPDSWQTTTTIDLVIGDDGQIETLGSPMALDSNESRRFFRVKVR